MVDEPADVAVDGLYRSGERRIVTATGTRLVLRENLRIGFEGGVDGVQRQIAEERLFRVGFDELKCLCRERVRQLAAVLVPVRVLVEVQVPRHHGHLEPLALGPALTLAEVPHAEEPGRVPGVSERLGERDEFGCQLWTTRSSEQAVVREPRRVALVDDRVDAVASGPLAGHEARTRRGAVGRARVGRVEDEPFVR